MRRHTHSEKVADMSVVGHLREIRNRIAASIIALLAAFIICFAGIRPLADALLQLGVRGGFQFVYLAPSELLTSDFKLALLLAVALTSPFLLFQIWGFVAPALTAHEKRAVWPALTGGLCFFALGAIFCYFTALPLMLRFLVSYNQSALVRSAISVASYLDFMTGMLLTFGIVFEEPMLAFILARLGIVTPSMLRKARRYAMPAIFVIAAIITPPDVVSQLMLGLPMIGLYETSILIAQAAARIRSRSEPEADAS